MSDSDGISVTLKQDEPGGKYNDDKSPGTWIVFHGSPTSVREQIIETFDLKESVYETMPLYELVVDVTATFKGAINVAEALGGRVIDPSEPPWDAQPRKATSGDAWAQAAEEPQQDPEEVRLLGAIEAATTVAELKELYARENGAEFNEAVKAAWNAKGKSLSS